MRTTRNVVGVMWVNDHVEGVELSAAMNVELGEVNVRKAKAIDGTCSACLNSFSSPPRCVLIDKLDFLVRFWELKARNASLGEPLQAKEQIELLSLMQLVTGDLDVPSIGPYERPKSALPAQMIGDGTILPVEIRSVSAGAVLVSGAGVVPAGAQVILRAADAISGVEYALPCNVVWVYRGAPTIMALSVDGIPTRSVFAGIPEPRLSMPLALGKRARLVG